MFGQAQNLLHFCRDPVVIIHVNAAFRAAIDADPGSAEIFRQLKRLPGVFVNPAHLPTKWAHMFHGHVSNIHYLEQNGVPYTHLVLCSSADLFFRRGAEEHVAAFDVGLEAVHGPTRAGLGMAGWDMPLKQDELFWQMMTACGSDRCAKSAHEGTFYRREILLRAVELLDRWVTDWQYDDRYPKEEFFLPSIVRALVPDAKVAPRLSHILGLGATSAVDRLAVLRAMRELGAVSDSLQAPLSTWLADLWLAAQDPPPHIESRFMLARLVRSNVNPLRQLIRKLAETLRDEERIDIVDRVDCFDVIAFDVPGRVYAPTPPMLSPAVTRTLHDRPSVLLLGDLAMDRVMVSRELVACPATYLPPQKVWGDSGASAQLDNLQSCAAHLSGAGAHLSVSVADGALILEVAAEEDLATPVPGERPPEIFVFWPIDNLDPHRHRAIRMRVEGSSELLAQLSVWIELHGMGRKRALNIGAPLQVPDSAQVEERLWILDRPANTCTRSELGPGDYKFYIAVPPITGSIALREVAALS